MIKTSILCDFCGKEMDQKDYFKQQYFHKSPTKVWDLSGCGLVICELCALKIDNELLAFKLRCKNERNIKTIYI